MKTVTFSIRYEVPVSPERIVELDEQIATYTQMEESARSQNRHEAAATYKRIVERYESLKAPAVVTAPAILNGKTSMCPRCKTTPPLLGFALAECAEKINDACPGCGAEVIKEEHSVSLDVFRIRTRRTDGMKS